MNPQRNQSMNKQQAKYPKITPQKRKANPNSKTSNIDKKGKEEPPKKKIRIEYADMPVPKKNRSEVIKMRKKEAARKHKYPRTRRKKRKIKKKKNDPKTQFFYNIRDSDNRYDSGVQVVSKFNNWVKSVLITKYVKKDDDVLDIASGHGGDLAKFDTREIRSWTGVDIVGSSVDDARKRYNKQTNYYFDANFVVADVSRINLQKNTNKIRKKFDVVTCMFAMHYFFETQKTLDCFLTNVSQNLKLGGHFVATTVDAYVVKKKLNESKNNIVENGMYKFEFDYKNFPKEKGYCGIRYMFTLAGAVIKCPEYIVHPEFLKETAKKYDLEIVEELNFHDFIDKYKDVKEYKDIFMKYYKVYKITDQEWDTVYIYKVFVFKKRGVEEEDKYMETRKRIKNHHMYGEDAIINLTSLDDDDE